MNNLPMWLQITLSIMSGLAVCIPLVAKLANSIALAVKNKNWPRLMEALPEYIAEAEKKFTDNATRKEWVMSMIKVTAKQVNYELTEVDIKNISDMIDKLCTMAKKVNVESSGLSKEVNNQ